MLALVTVPGTAYAGVVDFYSRSAWTAASGGSASVETFESEPEGLFSNHLTAAGVRLMSSASFSAIRADFSNTWGMRNTTEGGRMFVQVGDNTENTSGPAYWVQFTLPTMVTAFGFEVGGFQYPPLRAVLIQGNLAVEEFDFISPANSSFSAFFAGFTSTTAFDSVRFWTGPDQGGDDFSIDQVSWVAVPSPAALAVFATGSVLGARRSRR